MPRFPGGDGARKAGRLAPVASASGDRPVRAIPLKVEVGYA
jgi:hypothetical protein